MVIDDLKLIFVHIPRTGGTSVEKAFGYSPLCETKTPKQIVDDVGIEKWKSYHKFSVVRNPFDRLVSQWMYSELFWAYPVVRERGVTIEDAVPDLGKSIRTIRSFSGYVQELYRHFKTNGSIFNRQVQWIVYGMSFTSDPGLASIYASGQLVVDEVIRMEDLDGGMKKVFDKYKPGATLPHINKSSRGPYQEYYSKQDIALASEMMKNDLDYFGYAFETV